MWCASVAEHHAERSELQQKRVVVVDRDTTWHDPLLPSQKERLGNYIVGFQAMVASGVADPSDSFICDLDHNPWKWGTGAIKVTAGTCVPSLIQHGRLYHSSFQRPLSTLERCRVHCWPVTSAEIDAVGCLTDLQSMLLHQRVSHAQLTKMIGDSWHLRIQGMILMYAMASLELRDMKLRRMITVEFASTDFSSPPCKRGRHAVDSDGITDPDVSTPGSVRSLMTVHVDSSDAE